jgi:hypothetical protein
MANSKVARERRRADEEILYFHLVSIRGQVGFQLIEALLDNVSPVRTCFRNANPHWFRYPRNPRRIHMSHSTWLYPNPIAQVWAQ